MTSEKKDISNEETPGVHCISMTNLGEKESNSSETEGAGAGNISISMTTLGDTQTEGEEHEKRNYGTIDVMREQVGKRRMQSESSSWRKLKVSSVSKAQKFKVPIFLFLFGIYIIVACSLHFQEAWPILLLYSFFLLHYISTKEGNLIDKSTSLQKLEQSISTLLERRAVSLSLYAITIILILLLCVLINYENPHNLICIVGLATLVIIGIIISDNRGAIRWRIVVWGLTLQFAFALFVLRTKLGFELFEFLGDFSRRFLDLSKEGIEFVFKPAGSELMPIIFGVSILMVVIFFSAFISAMYHLGIMQFIIGKLGWMMQKTMGTSGPESTTAAANIFVGQTEAPLLVKPFLETMTLSELHSIMTSGFATIAGGVFAAYVAMGISASHLISASVMSAPAALAFSKIVYPENLIKNEYRTNHTEKTKKEKTDEMRISPYSNVVEAVSAGASDGMTMVLNIIANLIAYLSLLAAINWALTWLGSLVNIAGLTLELISQYLFFPLAYVLGADPEDCLQVAELIGLKTFANEFVAYSRLSKMQENCELSARSDLVATYALCGFSNIGAVGAQIGGLSTMAPSRRSDLAKLGLTALIAGSLACFSTACIAGLLYPSGLEFSAAASNSTSSSLC